ncbi:MAG TPA: porin [Thermoanaerobaculia bacterium]|nr:porin [Thermoanaerobaculia bacterium]
MKQAIAVALLVLGFGASPLVADDTQATTEQKLEELDQKVRVLERKAELENEQDQEKARSTASAAAGKEGFSFKSADGAFQIKLRGYVQLDARAFLDDQERPATDTFVLRRVRPIVEGTLFSRFDFRLMPDFGAGATVLQDAYLEARFSPALKLRAGKFKAPFGLERLQSATDLLFVERGQPTSLAPNRDLGLQLGGDLAHERLSYALAVMNGVVDGGSADADTNDAKELVGRVFFTPWAADKGSPLAGLGFGLAASSGRQKGSPTSPGLPAYRTLGQQTLFSYRSDATVPNTVLADGRHERFSPQLYFSLGRFGLLAESVRSSQEVRRAASTARLGHQAHQLAVSFVLAGGKASYKGVPPQKVFDPAQGGWGAFELVARWNQLSFDRDSFPTFANPASSARRADSLGVGFNWYLTRGVRLMLDYDQTRFDGGATNGDRPDEKALFSRFQIAY